jgi:hypothetical protein
MGVLDQWRRSLRHNSWELPLPSTDNCTAHISPVLEFINHVTIDFKLRFPS